MLFVPFVVRLFESLEMKNREGEIVFGTGGKILARNFFPLIAIKNREENIGARVRMDFGVVEAICQWQRPGEDLSATDDEELGFAGGLGELDAGVQRGNDLGICGLEAQISREHDQFAARHFALRALVGFATHEDVMAHGEAAEMLEIVREVPGQAVVAADAALFVDRRDN